jgi:hypothetical protein
MNDGPGSGLLQQWLNAIYIQERVKVRGCLAWPDRAVATCSTEQSPRPSLIESAVILDLLTLIILFGQLSCIRPQQIGRRVQIHCRLGPLCRRPLRIELPCTYRAKQIDNNNNNNNNRVQRSITDQPVHHYLQLRPTIFITRSTLRIATSYFGSGRQSQRCSPVAWKLSIISSI